MAPVYQSTQTSGAWTDTTSVQVNKPTGLAVGDLMIAQQAASANDWNSFAGFNNLGGGSIGGYAVRLGFKVADSSDVAASTFTFSTLSSRRQHATITRISNVDQLTSNYKYNDGSQENTTSPSLTATVTPVNHADSTLLLQFWLSATATSDITGYAIATSNPSWTEAYDVADSTNARVAMAYALRPQFTATGNISCSGGGGTTDWIGQMLSIPSSWNFNITDSLTTADTSKNSPGIYIRENLALTESTDIEEITVWSNVDKNTSTWSNQDKS